MSGRYKDDDGRLRCLDCDGYVVEGKPCRKCANAAKAAREADRAAHRAAEAEARRVKEADNRRRWRQSVLRAHVDAVLSRKGAERKRYMDAHPLSELFK